MSPCNIMWSSYTLPIEQCRDSSACRASSKVIEVLILAFPALDVISIYPVNVIILTNNVIQFIEQRPGVDGADGADGANGADGETMPLIRNNNNNSNNSNISGVNSGENSDATYKPYKHEKAILATINILPIAVSLLLPGFSKAIVFTGGISLVLCLIFPTVFGIIALNDKFKDYYDDALGESLWNIKGAVNSRGVQVCVLVVGVVCTVVVLGTTMF
jgi:hypothetical protein